MLIRFHPTRSICAVIASCLCCGLASAPVRAVTLADTQADFSTAAQGTSGFEYGAYSSNPTPALPWTTGPFSTAGFTVNGTFWDGNEGLTTPSLWAVGQHPAYSSLRPAVRRYTVGSSAEPSYTGLVEIKGTFNDLDAGGITNGFITVNGVNLFTQQVGSTAVPFDVITAVLPGSTIDIGVNAGSDGGTYDSTGMVATIATVVPEPGSIAAFATVVTALLRRRLPGH